jgi:hypothetical protein
MVRDEVILRDNYFRAGVDIVIVVAKGQSAPQQQQTKEMQI